MTLTLRQASRLFGLADDFCQTVVERSTCRLPSADHTGAESRRRRTLSASAGRRASPGRRTPRPTPSASRSASGCGWMVSLRSVAFAPISIASTPSAISSPAPGADEPDAQHALGLRIEDQLGQAVGAVERDRAAGRAPRELGDRRPRGRSFAACASVSPAQASSGSVKTTAGIARGSKPTFSPAITSTATRPSCDALCASIGSPATSPMAKIDGSAVRRCSSTTMKPRSSTCDARAVEAGNLRVRPAADRDQHAIEQLLGPSASAASPSNVDADALRLGLHLHDLRVRAGRSSSSARRAWRARRRGRGRRPGSRPGVISTTVTALPSAA